MDRRYMLLGAIIIIVGVLLIVGPATAKTAWSIREPTDENKAFIEEKEAEGFWNFAYDDAAPYTTAGLYCCWWERWYKWQKFSTWKSNAANTMNLGSSESIVDTKSFTPETATAAKVAASPTLTQIQPEDGYCPSCCSICDDETAMELQAKSDAIMAKKPWLTEGKNKATTQSTSTSTPKTTVASVTAAPTIAQMTFSDAV
ncbi:MAG: hypothetical protein LUQ50_03030 [Methanospirillum sp.]|uniref:hypothetical protein n=1 Tax=Methanospirillum sp. TaxID=45200 RepID=UPI00236BD743|nr:hypothetical protein [Methanospirillum sp.]MDD1728028.1 hypothetical protein [Methanospirillum sp.]